MRHIVLVDHGSRRSEANAAVERLAEPLAQLTGAPVTVAHMELASPLYADVIRKIGADPTVTELVVVPLFFAPGKHYEEDIERPARVLAQQRSNLAVRLLDPAAADPAFPAYLADRIAAASCGRRRR